MPRNLEIGMLALGILTTICPAGQPQSVGQKYRSHPPLRTAPAPAQRPLPKGPVYFVDAVKGQDQNDGGKTAPSRTIGHAIRQLKAGDTLYLRGGTYYENVRIALAGRKDAPHHAASVPGEQAVIDGGMREFFEAPDQAWQPFDKGEPGEFRSTLPFPNLRNVVGSFGDSMVGLQTYYHARDLRAASEIVEPETDKSDVKPLYCGPGLWYDRGSGYLHARLAHTDVAGQDNYRGEIDPRKLPLVIAPFRSLPLHLDRAEHVNLQDLVIRGGGHDTVILDQASDVAFDNVTVWCGTYGMRIIGTQRLKVYRSALYGNVAPWTTRFESGFNTYPGRTQRDITRQNTHALLVAAANREFDVYCFPFNDDWDISYSEFTDGSDGLYLGGVSMRFHHNLVHNMHDDGVYLSPMYPRHYYLRGGAKLHVYQNYFARALTMFAFGGTDQTQDTIYFYRNVVDLREPIHTGRPAVKGAVVAPFMGQVMGDHGSPPWPSMMVYHNTVVVRSPARASDTGLIGAATKERPRRFFNNILLHLTSLPALSSPEPERAHADGNLYWQPGLDAKQAAGYFAAFRAGAGLAASQQAYPAGFHTRSLVADPKLARAAAEGKNDYRLQPGSPAVDAGVMLPADWPDPLRALDKGQPDPGALPLGAEALKVGRAASP